MFQVQVKNFGNQVKVHSPKKIKSLVKVPYVAHLKIQVVSLKMNLFYFPLRDPRPSYPFRENVGRSDKGSFADKAKIVDRGSLCSPLESTSSKLQYEPYLFSVAGS